MTDAHPAWDAALLADLRGPDRGGLSDVMRFITDLGGTQILDIVFAVAMGALLALRRRRDALFLLLASPGTVLLVQILKRTVERPRPAGQHLAAASGASWPSGHASSSMALYGALLLIASGTWEHGENDGRLARRAVWGAVIALVALIGFSRLYLGVHYATDVVAAWALVATWLAALRRGLSLSPPER